MRCHAAYEMREGLRSAVANSAGIRRPRARDLSFMRRQCQRKLFNNSEA